jgi:hypothetical protein
LIDPIQPAVPIVSAAIITPLKVPSLPVTV